MSEIVDVRGNPRAIPVTPAEREKHAKYVLQVLYCMEPSRTLLERYGYDRTSCEWADKEGKRDYAALLNWHNHNELRPPRSRQPVRHDWPKTCAGVVRIIARKLQRCVICLGDRTGQGRVCGECSETVERERNSRSRERKRQLRGGGTTEREKCNLRRAARRQHLVPLIVKQRGVCGICNERFNIDNVSLDHVVPLSRGGTNHPGNLQAVHLRCNLSKGNRESLWDRISN